MKRFLILLTAFLASSQIVFAAVNINTATVDELDAVKSITPAKAKAIVEYRTQNGPFKSLDDLKNVKGFREKSIAKVRSELTVGEATASSNPAPAKAAKR